MFRYSKKNGTTLGEAVMQDEKAAWPPLRIAVVVAVALGTTFWIGCVVQWWRIPQASRDGLELLGLGLATAYFALLVVPAAVMAFMGRRLVLAAMLSFVSLAIASDTLHPWLPWHWVPGPS